MDLGLCFHPGDLAGFPSLPFDFIEGNVQSFLVPEQDDASFAPNLAAARSSLRPLVAANCFLPGGLKCVGPVVDQSRLEHYAATAFRRAEACGIEVIVFGSGGSRRVPDGFAHDKAFTQFVDLLRAIAPLAARHRVTLVVEPLNRAECNFINSLAEGAEVVKAAGHSSVRLLADFYHMLREDESPDEIRRHGSLLAHTHIAERDKRTPVGVAGDDFRPHLAALRTTGFRGRLAFECNWSDVHSQVARSVETLRRMMADVGWPSA